MAITAADVNKLRTATGAWWTAKALVEADGILN
jgi:translation elongation factor EF-Ts